MKNMRFNFKKGAMFGLDARIALAILGIVALSIGFVEEKHVVKNQQEETIQQLEFTKQVILRNWAQVFKFDISNSNAEYEKIFSYRSLFSGGFSYPLSNGTNFTFYSKRVPINVVNARLDAAKDFTHPTNGDSYILQHLTVEPATLEKPLERNYSILMNKNVSHNSETSISTLLDLLPESIYTKLLATMLLIEDDFGGAFFTTHTDSSDAFFNGSLPFVAFAEDSFGNPVKFYIIVETYVNKYNVFDYITHFVLYSEGKNKTLESTRPETIMDLKTFTPSGDDIFEIFSDKYIYMDNQLEAQKRLNEIRENLANYAENKYMERVSMCTTQTTPNSFCDLDSDGDYDNQDEALLLNLNPFPKASEDSNATYMNTTNYFTNVGLKPTGFLNELNLPHYYSYNRYGVNLKYDSNVNNTENGPFTVEVWY